MVKKTKSKKDKSPTPHLERGICLFLLLCDYSYAVLFPLMQLDEVRFPLRHEPQPG